MDRQEVAEELCEKDGQVFDKLDDVMKNAYLHNADLAIADREQVVVDGVPVKSQFTCPRCQDTAYIGGKPCLECNKMGLPGEEVHPGAVTEEIPEPTSDEKVTPPAGAARTLKPGEYYCTECKGVHRESSKLGKKHLKLIGRELVNAIRQPIGERI